MRLPLMLWRWLCSLLVRYQLWSQEHYLDDAKRTGVHSSLDLNAFAAERDALRIRLIDLSPSAARAKGARKPQDDAIQPAGAETDGAGTNRVRA